LQKLFTVDLYRNINY